METLAWTALEPHLDAEIPVVLQMGGTRGVRIGFDPTSETLFLRLPLERGSTIPPSPYAELTVEAMNDEEGVVLEIATRTHELFREFHRFSGILTEDFEQPAQTAVGAFETAIHRWRDFGARKKLLTEEQRLGLQGELTFLRSLLRLQGSQSIAAWTGRSAAIPERHDFRMETVDLEIKATNSAYRRHVIHGLGQLQETPGRPLYILSLKFESAGLGPGRSLPDEIQAVRGLLLHGNSERQTFETTLSAAGYLDADAIYYEDRLRLADPPVLIPVNDLCPRITQTTLAATIPSTVSGRISDLSYRIEVDGLGVPQGSIEFSRVMGELQVEP